MRKILLSCSLLVLALCINTQLKAAAGDTTWVQANKVNLDYYNNFDSRVLFPDGSKTYRQILQIFTLGTYSCPSGTQYCHQWDYTVTNYVMKKGGDTAEVSRFITPYANTGVPRFPTTWKQDYVFDVTDYVNLMKDSAIVRINYSGYSGGFTANVRFAFIEGTPVRNVVGQQRLWSNYFTYGNATDPIQNHVLPYKLKIPGNTTTSELKMTITGHGADQTDNCCEFTNTDNWHSYYVKLNNSTVDSKKIYKDDCGSNELYPQGGTWIYNRANWCPGASVHINAHKLNATDGNSLGLDFSAYTSSGNYGGFQVNGEVIYYGTFNRQTDASMVHVVSPNNDQNFFRENPANSKPMVRVRNTGGNAITSITFEYGVKDSAMSQYVWNGTIAPLKDTLLTLPSLPTLVRLSLNGNTSTQQFVARIKQVNGVTDEDNTNNTAYATFNSAPVWPNKFIVSFRTNNEGVTGLNVGPAETSWQITDMAGKVVASRVDADINKQYNDTITLPSDAMYQLTITDLGCDGLHWWVYDQNPGVGVKAGSFLVKKVGGGNIAMNGYNYGGTFGNDFGCGFTQNFTTKAATAGIDKQMTNAVRFDVFPNPATSNLWVAVNNTQADEPALVSIMDVMGNVMLNQKIEASENGIPVSINIESLSAGMYEAVITCGGNKTTKRFSVVK